MIRGIEAAKNGMLATLDSIDNISNNLANVNTTGYKQTKLVFKNIHDNAINQLANKNDPDSKPQYLGSLSIGSKADAQIIDFAQGGLRQTGNPLDVGINGQGFLKVQMPDGNIGYTRNGNLVFQNDGTITTKDNMPILDEKNSPIQIELNNKQLRDVLILKDGTIASKKQVLGKIDVVDFKDKVNMMPLGSSLYVPKDKVANAPIPAEKFNLVQGSLESSNANVIECMVNTINAERAYESLNNVMQMDSKALEKSISSVGRVNR